MTSEITIVSLGPGDPDLLNAATVSALCSARDLILRTERHPAVAWLKENRIAFSTLDELYDGTDDFDKLDRRIASFLLQRVTVSPVVYAVPDAPTDHTVRALFALKPSSVRAAVIPGVSTYDICTAASLPCSSDPALLVAPASDLLEGYYHDPKRSILITELDNPILAGEIKLLLSDTLDDEYRIWLLQDRHPPVSLRLYELDRRKGIDHRTCVLVPGSGFRDRSRFVLNDLAEIMETLRAPGGCPWDRAQTHESLRPYVVEEAWECVAAIEENDMDHLCEELGDLLFQAVFHASIGRSFDEFTLGDVLTGICAKMLRRHPHVFADAKADDADSVRAAWEKIKEEETGHQTVVRSLEDVPSALPSLKYAAKTLKKLTVDVNGIPDSEGILVDIQESAGRIAQGGSLSDEDKLGELLLLCSALCFRAGIDGEVSLRRAVDRLRSRIISADRLMKKQGKSLEHLTFDELRVYLKHVEGEIE